MTTNSARADGYRSDAHAALAQREQLLADALIHRGQEAVFAGIAQDREERWAALLAGREESASIREWAQQMAIVCKNPRVRIHRSVLPWVTALYVARYGEAEDCWQPALTHGDLARARVWLLKGDAPEGVSYLPREA